MALHSMGEPTLYVFRRAYFLVRSSLLSTYITVSTPLLDVMPTLDLVESLPDTAKCLSNPQVTSCWGIVQLLEISMPL